MPLAVKLQLLIYVNLIQCAYPLSSAGRVLGWSSSSCPFSLFQQTIFVLRSFFSHPTVWDWGKRSMERAVNGWGAVYRLVSHCCRYSKTSFLCTMCSTLPPQQWKCGLSTYQTIRNISYFSFSFFLCLYPQRVYSRLFDPCGEMGCVSCECMNFYCSTKCVFLWSLTFSFFCWTYFYFVAIIFGCVCLHAYVCACTLCSPFRGCISNRKQSGTVIERHKDRQK